MNNTLALLHLLQNHNNSYADINKSFNIYEVQRQKDFG